MSSRRNPPVSVREVSAKRKTFDGQLGHRISQNVLAVEYAHEHSARRTPFRHDFEIDGIELWVLADGSILIRHPSVRLWDDFIVNSGD